MITEFSERRVLGALQFVSSVNQLPVPGPMDVRVVEVSGPQPPALPRLSVMRNGQGLLVIHQAPGLAEYVGRWDAAAPAVRTLRLRAVDRSGSYLPTEFLLPLPRDIDPIRLANGHFNAGSVFEPMVVALLPSPKASEAANWAVLRIHLWHETEMPPGSGVFQAVPSRGGLVRIYADEPAPRRLLGRGLTEWREVPGLGHPSVAEALVAVPDVPVTQWSNLPNAAVLTPDQGIRIEVRRDSAFDPAARDAVPNLTRLEPPGNAALPNGVIAALLPGVRQLRAGLRETLPLLLAQDGSLSVM